MAKRIATNNSKKKARGIILTILLVLVSLLSLLSISTNYVNDWAFYIVAATKLLLITGVILMWLWKKIGVYLLVASVVLFTYLPPLLATHHGLPPASSLEYISISIWLAVLLGLLYLIIRPKWNLFS